MALLGKAGIPADQASYVAVGAGDTFIAGIQQGRIDAGMTTEPTISRLVQSGQGKDVTQRLVNAYAKTLKWMHAHTAAQIADQMPADYYAGSKDLYVSALQNQLQIFGTDCKMPAGGPETVLKVEQNYVSCFKGKTADLSKTYTNDFAAKAAETGAETAHRSGCAVPASTLARLRAAAAGSSGRALHLVLASSFPALFTPAYSSRLERDLSYQRRTRMARRVFQRLGRASLSSMSKCTAPGWGLSSGHRPAASRLDSTMLIASATRSSGTTSAARR